MEHADQPLAPTVVTNLYAVTGITVLAGIEDYTEGIYHGDPSVDFARAKRNQHEYLLDEVKAKQGFRLLEVGCGLGTLLEAARERGARAVGITISPQQHKTCREKGLDVYSANYRHLPAAWRGQFDGIIANGSLEHFCQPEDALVGKQEAIYTEMFRIFANLLDPHSPYQTLVTTAIHFRGSPIAARKFLTHPLRQLFDHEGMYASILHRGYGGYYPAPGQLQRCAVGSFRLLKERDGTEDYRITSEYWCTRYRQSLIGNQRFQLELIRHFLKHPLHTTWVVLSFIGLKAWAWQFRGLCSPARLCRHTWQRVSRSL